MNSAEMAGLAAVRGDEPETAEAGPFIHLTGVSRRYRSGTGETETVLDDVELVIDRGSLTVIRGASGSGKTTLLRIIGLLDTGFDGSYHLGKLRIDGAPAWQRDEIRSDNIGFIFQEGLLFGQMNIEDNVSVPLLLAGETRVWRRNKTVRSFADTIFHSKELDDGVLKKRPQDVSGGQRQRASIMRAMISEPGLILADEPTASLHPRLKAEIVAKLCKLRDIGHTVVVVSHDEVFYDLGRQLELKDGQLHEVGSSAVEAATPIFMVSDSAGHGDAAPGHWAEGKQARVSLDVRDPAPGRQILWGWRPRAPMSTIAGMAWREAFYRPLFMTLILTALILGVCQISVFSSVLIGTNAFIDRTITEGSRLNRIEISPRSADRAEDERFPLRAEMIGWADVSAVVPRRESTLTVVLPDGSERPYPGLGLHPDDPEYGLVDFVAGGPFTGDDPQIILSVSLANDLFGVAAGSEGLQELIGRNVDFVIPIFPRGATEPSGYREGMLEIVGIILNGESGRQLYMPSTAVRVFDRLKRDRDGAFEIPLVPGRPEWTDPAEVVRLADWAWEDKLHVYTSEIRSVIPVFAELARLGFQPQSDIWNYKWALDIQDTAWAVFIPILILIALVVAITIFTNVFTSAALKQKELALWRVLGMRRGDLISVQLISTAMLVTVGALIGLIIGNELLDFLRAMLKARAEEAAAAPGSDPLEFDLLFAPLQVFAAPLFMSSVLLGILAAVYPSVRASHVDPARVLSG